MYKSYYPVNFDICGKKCVVVGGGKVAERKAKSLLEFKGRVTVVAPEITSRLKKLLSERKITHISKKYDKKYIKNSAIVIGATSDRSVNQKISIDAKKYGIPVNIVDDPELCSFIVPSKIKRGPLVVSISTSGQAPALSKALRYKLQKIVTPDFGRLALKMGSKRKRNAKS